MAAAVETFSSNATGLGPSDGEVLAAYGSADGINLGGGFYVAQSG